ncbi:MAG: NADP oxidoreductase [Gammaproteobacteria bacterium]|uniref:NADH-quinone oxidoreductase subunit B family protein n=1 Tax=Rhodoferax sp. TaxID=50421 RepID=UPI00180C309E|nr:NADP oxidoreductase [Rhodoferax sp.]MBU3899461.1 NADP oxidoreductase [Gammaproteobacteria bacterium]MBA3057239.1 NADP oxidoreductase [Rhodoferax sp.]MBU3996365.1 NADP oxidoreductase [Gammaproteobacteria bacterium]MBU4080716.1 NADP oxidoreductase [Gammaproteobacteria bacterium]MBU4113494.1 NADP oxidoreductase [Gammaproteobacteria bacterium]
MSNHAVKQADSAINEMYSHDLPRTPVDAEFLASQEGKIKVSMIGLCGCWGCTLSVLDMDERLLGLLDKVTILRSSLTDIKRIPERCVVGFVEGGVANEENIETLEHFRENCDILISVGACAIWGGVPAMRNQESLSDCLAEAYIGSPTVVLGVIPIIPDHPDIPKLTTKVYPCHDVVKMDYFIPGCPPDGDAILKVLDDLVNGRPVNLPTSINRYD